MIKIARYNQEQKRFEIESTGCENMDGLVDTGHEALHTRERIKLFDDSIETEKNALLDLYLELSKAVEDQANLLLIKQTEYNQAYGNYCDSYKEIENETTL